RLQRCVHAATGIIGRQMETRHARPDSAVAGALHPPQGHRAPPYPGAPGRAAAGGARLGAGRGRPRPGAHLPLPRLPPHHGLRERAGLDRAPGGPPPGPGRALRPLRGALLDPRRRRPERERLHLRRQGLRPARGLNMIRALSVSTALFGTLLLAACGRDDAPPAAPVPPPTEIAAVDTPPPQYPAELGCAGIDRQSVLQVEDGTEGTRTATTLQCSTGNEELDRWAQEAVQACNFRQATCGGQPSARTIQVPVNFPPPQVRPDECFALDAGRRP